MITALLLLLAQPAAEAEADECDDPQTQMALNLCALAYYEAADAELNQVWADVVTVMRAADAARERGDRQPGYYETLLEAQRAWLKYRDAECMSQSFMARGGTMQPMLDSQCKAYLTEERTEQLRSLAAGLEPE